MKMPRCSPARPRGVLARTGADGVKVAPHRAGDAGRNAEVALRAGPVTLKRPRHGSAKTDPETVSMTLVEAREINPPANEEPLLWRLLTSIEVGDPGAAHAIVALYRLRWRIEEVFRALKSDGMRLEETQMHDAGRLFKLADWRQRVEPSNWWTAASMGVAPSEGQGGPTSESAPSPVTA